MAKQELMETYTEEQLEEQKDKKQINNTNAEFLEEIEKIEEYRDARAEDLSVCGADLLFGEVKGLNYVLKKIEKFRFEVGEIEDLKEENKKKQEEIDRLKKLSTEIQIQLKECIDANQYNIKDFESKIDEFRDEEERLKSEVEKYRKAFEDAKKERDCQIMEYQKKIEELTVENAELHCELQAIAVIPDEIPTEPIKVADMLINADVEYERNPITKALYKEDKGVYRVFDVSELRQIAEHLLVYCNHNGEVEE